ncbi:HbrB-like protein [Polychaeton citri CBS 116435]|uniref:HbrB-like protein n=1 Tax=Polychaeton citri CBS 116435 TaxID=1314669 RepID=A0A9P4UQ38_9PEZI|nr:HbrB-like protein [Polychaeton citri CBS 116435]
MSSNLPPLRPPPRPHSPSGHRSRSSLSGRSESSLSNDSTDSSQPPVLPVSRQRSPYIQQVQAATPVRPSTSGGPTPSHSQTHLQNFSRPGMRTSVDGSVRTISPLMHQSHTFGHRSRQHSQGFFEPSLPHATANNTGLSASQIAAQAAMHHSSPSPTPGNGERKRSHPGLAPINTNAQSSAQSIRRPSDNNSPQVNSAGPLPYSNGLLGGNRLAATTAANVVFPNGRSPLPSPNAPERTQPQPHYVQQTSHTAAPVAPGPPLEKEPKSKSSKMKLFSKPKNLTLSKEKDPSKLAGGMPSPGKAAIGQHILRNNFANASSTSLMDPSSSSGASFYGSTNASTSTLVPTTTGEKDKDKQRHHFLSRQKHKLKDDGYAPLPLSSAHSNSLATNPDKPQPLYNFTPDSPGASGISKSVSGFDLRHGGKALREKRKEEKAAAKLDLQPVLTNTSAGGSTGADAYLSSSLHDSNFGLGTGQGSMFSFSGDQTPGFNVQAFSNIGASMGLPGIGPDDAWPLLKARLLNVFSGEQLRTPIEDFNLLVSVHIRRCIQRHSPIVLVEDVRELMQTGFGSLGQTLRAVPDDRLVSKLVEMWIGVYGAILPFLQAVFLPLDLEFKGRGTIMSVREAQEFWGVMPEALKRDDDCTLPAGDSRQNSRLGEDLDIRRITLITFRDTVILPRHESLMAIFSRLSLDNLNATSPNPPNRSDTVRAHAFSDPSRPDTAGSMSPHMSSFNSQGSTLLDASSTSSGGGGRKSLENRSRATSNTSAGSFGTSLPHLNSPSLLNPHHPGREAIGSLPTSAPYHPAGSPASQQPAIADPQKVTDTVARMLQCLYVLGSCHTGDVGQGVVERLTGALKYNWLGRGRTGRDRRGWVGMKAGPSGRGGAGLGVVGA